MMTENAEQASPGRVVRDNEASERFRPNAELTYIQMLRGVAASLVVFAHFADIPAHSWVKSNGLSQLGTSGVDLFFVISGFIMVYTTGGRAGGREALQFLLKRGRRIYPLYWFWTTVLLVLWLAGVALSSHLFPAAYIFCSYALFPSHLSGVADPFRPLLIQGWTLSFEMLFYLVFAASILIGLKRLSRLAFLAASFTLLYLAGKPLPPNNGLKYLVSNSIVVEFLFGVLVAEVVLRMATRERSVRSMAMPFMCIAASALLCTTRLHFSMDTMRCIVYGIPAAFIVFGAAMMGSRPVNSKLLYLGNASYSIYLSHYFFSLAFQWAIKHTHALDRIQPDALIIAMTAITIALSSLTYPLERLLQFKRPAPSPAHSPEPVPTAAAWRTR
jgi:peptidoglycan/LPS O-acetylase OafA/YrhL